MSGLIIAAPKVNKGAGGMNKPIPAPQVFPNKRQGLGGIIPAPRRGEREYTSPTCGYLRVRGLPFDASVAEICEVFQNFRLSPNNVFIGLENNGPQAGRPDGQCYVRFPNQRMVDQAVDQLQGVTLGSRYLELFPSDEDDFNQTWDEGRLEASPPEESVDFAGVPSRELGPTFPRGGGRKRRRPNHFGGGGYGGGNISGPPLPRPIERMAKSDLPPPSDLDGVVRVRGMPFSATAADLVDAFGEYGIQTSDIFMGLTVGGPKAGQPDGQAYIRFATARIATEVEVQKQGVTIGSRYLEIFQSSEEDLQYQIDRNAALDPSRNFIARGGGRKRQRQEDNFQNDQPLFNEDGDFGFVRLRGLPFSAQPIDVVDFFGASYGLMEEDVTMTFNHQGRASGECIVQLPSEESAMAAQQSLDRQTLGDRYIEVFLATAAELNRGRGGGFGLGGRPGFQR